MQTDIFSQKVLKGGGRISSPKLRQLQEKCDDFTGLEEGINRYDLLLLVKRAGKAAGFSPRMINLLDYYMAYTRDIDWEEGSRPIVYKSLSSTALDMGVSERQIQALEKQLFELGAITWHDSGNHKRYGQRCEESGQILYAFGVDLTPLAYLRSDLQKKLHEKELYDRAWKETKRQISYFRRQIRSYLLEAENREGESHPTNTLDREQILSFSQKYETIAVPIRTYIDLHALRGLLDKHKALFSSIESAIETSFVEQYEDLNETKMKQKDSPKDDSNCVHYKYTNHKQSNKLNTCRDNPISFQKSVAEPSQDNLDLKNDQYSQVKSKGARGSENEASADTIEKTGLQHVSLKQLLNVASDRFKDCLPIEPRPMNHRDFIDAAYKMKDKLGISQNSWGHACLTLGRIGAAVCVILTDQANLREENRVRKPAAYFNAMIDRAKKGELKLHQSIMGHLKREFGNDDEPMKVKGKKD